MLQRAGQPKRSRCDLRGVTDTTPGGAHVRSDAVHREGVANAAPVGERVRMTDDEKIFTRHVSRRGFLTAAGVAPAAGPLTAGPLAGTAEAEPAAELATTAGDPAKSPAVA